jgi:hypothetical protein
MGMSSICIAAISDAVWEGIDARSWGKSPEEITSEEWSSSQA